MQFNYLAYLANVTTNVSQLLVAGVSVLKCANGSSRDAQLVRVKLLESSYLQLLRVAGTLA